jgi:hypothetical protein
MFISKLNLQSADFCASDMPIVLLPLISKVEFMKDQRIFSSCREWLSLMVSI